MPTTTSYGGYTVPILGDTDNVATAFSTYAALIEPRLVKNFASSSARTTALTAAGLTTGTQLKGMLTWLDTPGRYEKHNGTAWVPLVPNTLTVSGNLFGTAYDGVSPTITYRYTAVATTNGSGGFSAPFPAPFPNGVISVGFFAGDPAGGLGFAVALPANHTLSQAQGIAYSPGGTAIASAGVRVEVDAVGW